ncbi:hypothetical protein ATY81_00630 [Rhizobium sp. R72]|uniref:hypothetical protein n=1 Tax=unclassified Rhizobium TaxID=2613769 RepID=UPI000B5340CC|nr:MULTISPECIES: hypothetical protein [unclassified Rhizobium]OWW04534.1 hypothetical protein ATY81_00630 [Rhizobium sp. R72]OWW05591.1 hypothetical protein ATY80_00630 [Rhizobium sp. R711]
MRISVAVGVAASLLAVSAAEAPGQWQTFHGVRMDSDPLLLARFDRAYRYCEPEAVYRGSPYPTNPWHVTALRSCMYRLGIVDRGAYAYPANRLFYPLY